MGKKIVLKTKFTISYTVIAMALFYGYDLMCLVLMHMVGSSLAKKISLFVLYTVFFMAVIKRPSRLKKDAVAVILVSMMLFAISYFVHPEYKYCMFEIPTWNVFSSVFNMSSGICAYLFFRMCDDDTELVWKSLLYAAFILFVWGVLRIYSSIQSGGFSRAFENGAVTTNSYDMSVGYRMLYTSIVFALFFLRTKGLLRFAYLGLSIVSAALMAVFGSRTAVLSLAVFATLYVLFCQRTKNTKKKLLIEIVFLLIAGCGYYVLNNQALLLSISETLAGMGFKSRILDTLVEGSVSLDLGRNYLYSTMWQMILKHPIAGNGVFADRYIGGIYCHQIVLEILVDYGFIFGGLILITMLVGIFFMLFKCDNREWKLIFLIFFSSMIIRLNLSSSYWCDTNFWATFAIVINYCADRKRKKGETYAYIGGEAGETAVS